MTRKDYTLRITSHLGEVSYVVRRGKSVMYKSGSEIPLSLSNLLSEDAAEGRLELENARDGKSAATRFIKFLQDRHKRQGFDMNKVPKVEVLQ